MNTRSWLLAAAGVGGGMLAYRYFRDVSSESLEGRMVLIMGGSRGLGLQLAREFASEGCRVAICARDSGELDEARRDLEQRGASIITRVCDVSDRNQVESTIAEVTRESGAIDILVNCAGLIAVGPIEAMRIEDFENAMKVMFWGTVYPTLSVLPHMLDRRFGRVVNITSIGGKVSVPHLVPYSCAKFAAVAFSEGLNAELSGKGVRTVTIAPGLMRTGSFVNIETKGRKEDESAWFSASATTPGLTMSAERAARQIVRATKRGEAERILTTPANLAARVHGAWPELTSWILSAVNEYILPPPPGEPMSPRRAQISEILNRIARKISEHDREQMHQPA